MTYYDLVFTVLVSATPVPRAASSYLSNEYQLLRIVKFFWGNRKEFARSKSGRSKEFYHLF